MKGRKGEGDEQGLVEEEIYRGTGYLKQGIEGREQGPV